MEAEERIVCFPPVINRSSRILILGSMPSVTSLQSRQYYGHPQNQFWKIMAALCGVESWRDYPHKIKTLLKHRMALWDVIDSCCRKGSADSQIKAVRINDFESLFKKYPNIRVVACDSGIAYALFKRFYSDLTLPVIKLPSPSTAYTLTFAKKLARWKRLLKYLD